MGRVTHVYCPNCDAVQPALVEPLTDLDVTGRFRGGDISCAVCGFVVVTLYEPVETTGHAQLPGVR